MTALSIRQPWAWLIVNGYKTVENRDWDTNFRGEILIHSGKKIDREGMLWIRKSFPGIELPTIGQLEAMTGGYVGIAELTSVVLEHPSPWFFGVFGFVLENAQPIEFIPAPGRLMLFQAPANLTIIPKPKTS